VPYSDIGINMNKARVAEAARGIIKLEKSCRFYKALAEEPKVSALG